MATQKIPVTFPNKDGLRLFGVLHQPAGPRHRPVILLLSPGVKMRVAPYRMYVKMAERFAALGFTVLRFDFHCLGDAEGEAPEPLLADFYGATQVGRFVADTVAAMDWMQQTYGSTEFIAAGLCGGALTGMLTAQRDPRITSLLGLSIPVILDGSNIDASKYLTDVQLGFARRKMLRKLRFWTPEARKTWIRFLTLQTDYRLMLKAITRPFVARLEAKRTPAAAAPAAAAGVRADAARADAARADAAQADARPADAMPANAKPANAVPADNTNPHFEPAWRRTVATGRPVFFIFAGADRLLAEYDAKFRQRHAAAVEQYRHAFTVHVTGQANHIFSFPEWQADMLDQSCRWLEQLVAARPSARAERTATAVPAVSQ